MAPRMVPRGHGAGSDPDCGVWVFGEATQTPRIIQQLAEQGYLIASGLIIDPVPPEITSGGPVKKNS